MDVRKKHKGSELDTNQKQLTDNDKRYYPVSDGDDVQLTIVQQIVVIDNVVASTFVLPSVAEVKGLSYDISILNNAEYVDPAAITLTDHPSDAFNDSVSWGGPYTLDTASDRIVLKSNGTSWSVTTNAIA